MKIEKINYNIKAIDDSLRKDINEILVNEWGATDIVIRGRVIDGTLLDGFVALKDNKIIGLLIYMIENSECEICSLNSFIENK